MSPPKANSFGFHVQFQGCIQLSISIADSMYWTTPSTIFKKPIVKWETNSNNSSEFHSIHLHSPYLPADLWLRWSTGFHRGQWPFQPLQFRLWCGPALEPPLCTVSGWLAEFDVNAWGRHDGLSPSEALLGWPGGDLTGGNKGHWWYRTLSQETFKKTSGLVKYYKIQMDGVEGVAEGVDLRIFLRRLSRVCHIVRFAQPALTHGGYLSEMGISWYRPRGRSKSVQLLGAEDLP